MFWWCFSTEWWFPGAKHFTRRSSMKTRQGSGARGPRRQDVSPSFWQGFSNPGPMPHFNRLQRLTGVMYKYSVFRIR